MGSPMVGGRWWVEGSPMGSPMVGGGLADRLPDGGGGWWVEGSVRRWWVERSLVGSPVVAGGWWLDRRAHQPHLWPTGLPPSTAAWITTGLTLPNTPQS